MSPGLPWLVVAPQREDDESLKTSAWVAEKTCAQAAVAPRALLGERAVRATFEATLGETPCAGVAFFGHGQADRLLDAACAPGTAESALLDVDNAHRLAGCWIHAFACLSGQLLAHRAVLRGVEIYVGYHRPLDVGWACPPPAEERFIALATAVTLALQAGERDARTLRALASTAADSFIEALLAVPQPEEIVGWMWLHKLAQDLVDSLVVVHHAGPAAVDEAGRPIGR